MDTTLDFVNGNAVLRRRSRTDRGRYDNDYDWSPNVGDIVRYKPYLSVRGALEDRGITFIEDECLARVRDLRKTGGPYGIGPLMLSVTLVDDENVELEDLRDWFAPISPLESLIFYPEL